MRTRNVIKNENFQCLLFTDTDGKEIEFPNVPDDGTPQKGDKVLVDGKEADSGTCTLPDGTAVFWEDGKVTEVQAPTTDTKNAKKVAVAKKGTCKTFSSWNQGKEQKVEILGNNEESPFRKGNRVLVNGKSLQLGKVEIQGKEMKISNGRISSVRKLNAKEPGTRNVINRPKGK